MIRSRALVATGLAAGVFVAALGVTAQAAPKPKGPSTTVTPAPVPTTTTSSAPATTAPTAAPTATATATSQPTATATATTEPTATATATSEPTSTATVTAAPTATASEPLGAGVTSLVEQKATALLARPQLTSPLSRSLTPAAPVINLDPLRDYVVSVPAGAVFTAPAAIVGGRNVVLEGQTLQYAAPVGASADFTVRGLLLKGQTGVMWVNGLQIRGPLAEGIDLDQRAPGVAVVLRNIAIDLVSGSYAGNHADLLQTWAGPSKLVVDGFTGSSNYQGMFLVPNDAWTGPLPEFFSLRNITMDVSTGFYALWTNGYNLFPVTTTNVAVRPNPARPSRNAWLWPKPSTGDTTWAGVLQI